MCRRRCGHRRAADPISITATQIICFSNQFLILQLSFVSFGISGQRVHLLEPNCRAHRSFPFLSNLLLPKTHTKRFTRPLIEAPPSWISTARPSSARAIPFGPEPLGRGRTARSQAAFHLPSRCPSPAAPQARLPAAPGAVTQRCRAQQAAASSHPRTVGAPCGPAALNPLPNPNEFTQPGAADTVLNFWAGRPLATY